LNERDLLLKLLIEELLILKKKYNVIRKTKIIKNINQNEELATLNNQILEDFINKKSILFLSISFNKLLVNLEHPEIPTTSPKNKILIV